MIDAPGVVVAAKPADSWQVEGMLASRAQECAMRYSQSLPETARRPYQVLVERAPAVHTGLGVGTQLGLAVAKALAVAGGEDGAPSTDLAVRVGRGERSAVGVHGFDRGGLIVDCGKAPGQQLSPLVEHVVPPSGWRVVLFSLPGTSEWHGARERLAFAMARRGDPDALRSLALTVLVPAARAGDLVAFGDAVHEFNRQAGAPFAEAQGGPYASAAIGDLIAGVRAAGIRGVGQSSWGPTVFAVVEDADTAMSLVLRFGRRVPVTVARVSPGHQVHQT
jgi:beta-RFAP synthase